MTVGLLAWLLGGSRRRSYNARKIDKALGPWHPYRGTDAIPRTRLPTRIELPNAVRKCGGIPGSYALDTVLFPYWLRLDRQLCGYVVQHTRKGGLYRRVEVPREGRPARVLEIPHPFLRFVQRRILSRLLEQMDVHPNVHGFLKGRSIFTGAEPHTGKRLVIHLDIRDFFPSITFRRVVGLFRSYGLEPGTALMLGGLCCVRGVLPQGAPSSPMISNLVCRRLDSRLSGLARTMDGSYSRYADDITFSGEENLLRILPLARKIISDEGFAVAPEKTAIMRSGARQRVTGLNVNTKVSVPRKVRRVLRAMVHQHVNAPTRSREMTAFLRGHVAFMRPAHPETAEKLERDLQQ